MERKNTLLLTVIAVATLLVAVVGATFAYFTATSNYNGSSSVDVVTSSVSTSATTGTSLNLLVLQSDMVQNDGRDDFSVKKEAAGGQQTGWTYTIPGSGENTAQQTVCPFEMSYTPDVTGNFNYAIENAGHLKELTLLYKETLTDMTFEADPTAVHAGVAGSGTDDGWYELDLAGITSKTVLVSGNLKIVGTTGTTDKVGSAKYDVKVRFYNLGVDQSSNANQAFGGDINVVVDQANCITSNVGA